jgi:hypothetical protein
MVTLFPRIFLYIQFVYPPTTFPHSAVIPMPWYKSSDDEPSLSTSFLSASFSVPLCGSTTTTSFVLANHTRVTFMQGHLTNPRKHGASNEDPLGCSLLCIFLLYSFPSRRRAPNIALCTWLYTLEPILNCILPVGPIRYIPLHFGFCALD